jgi:putative oxidoreductase
MALELDGGRRLGDVALIPGRMALGATMVYHGRQKLAGNGPEETGQYFEGIGIRPGKPWALATGSAELLAGLAAILGLAVRPAAVAVLVTQAVAIAKVHAKNGFDITKGGYEYNLALMALATLFLLRGPGRVSVHELVEQGIEGRGMQRAFRRRRSGLLRFLKLIK